MVQSDCNSPARSERASPAHPAQVGAICGLASGEGVPLGFCPHTDPPRASPRHKIPRVFVKIFLQIHVWTANDAPSRGSRVDVVKRELEGRAEKQLATVLRGFRCGNSRGFVNRAMVQLNKSGRCCL